MGPQIPDLSLLDLLAADRRPTLVVALPRLDPQDARTEPEIVYENPALAASPALSRTIAGKSPAGQCRAFWEWVLGQQSPGPGLAPDSFVLEDICWTRSVLRAQWVVVGGNHRLPSADAPARPRYHHHHRSGSAFQHAQTHTTPDDGADSSSASGSSTLLPGQEPFLDVVTSFDWAQTPLGPMDGWSHSLQQNHNQILADSRPIVMYWGSSLTIVYNEAFSKLCGSKHPGLLGKSVDDAWPDFCDKIKETMRITALKHRASQEDEWQYFVEQADGSLEETYLRWSIIPIIENGQNLGFMQPVLDTTSTRLWERRMKMLVDLGEKLGNARDMKSYWSSIMEHLEGWEPSYDVPVAVLYSVHDDVGIPSDSPRKLPIDHVCRVEGSLGVPPGHSLIQDKIVLGKSSEGLASAFQVALTAQDPILLQTSNGTLPSTMITGLQYRGFKDACREAVVCPIRPMKDESLMGILFLGINPRRPYDNDQQQHISLFSQKLASTLASTVLLEEEARRGRNIAEQAYHDQEQLRQKLTSQAREATEALQRFQAVAEFIPVGMAFGDSSGNITFANDAWHRITGIEKADDVTGELFLSRVIEEDRANVRRAYSELRKTATVEIEFRLYLPSTEDKPAPHPIGSSPAFEKAGLDLSVAKTQERHILAALRGEDATDGSPMQVLTCLTDVTLHKQAAEEAIRRAQEAENLKRMAEFATVGLFDMALDGRLIGANNVFYEMCGLEKVRVPEKSVKPLDHCVVDEDLPLLRRTLDALVNQGKPQTAELKLKTHWIEKDSAGNKIVAPRWVTATFIPVRGSENVVETFTGCFSDVSLQKWQFESERERKDEAIESKRQQENFIDMTSHEMRNPLSAIVQCTDAIIGSLTKVEELVSTELSTGARQDGPLRSPKPAVRESSKRREVLKLVQDGIENGETILIVANHQRRIVDDILTMSKLDSNLLSVTPTTVDPINILRETFKMFEVEARRVDIDLSMEIDQSMQALGIEFLDFDPSRLKQVLINLLTNALKFTKSSATGSVRIKMSAHKEEPTDETASVRFVPRLATSPGIVVGMPPLLSIETSEDKVYLMLEVTDTGQGLTEEEKSSLFQRFVQASPKTHVKYGGSGLGLFISRRLTEIQNGAIGVASRPGHGSTFTFYIEAFIPNDKAIKEARNAAKVVEKALHTPTNGAPKSFDAGLLRADLSTQTRKDAQIDGVLIVEDNLINQQISRRGLLDRGFSVEVANHGVEALEQLQRTSRAGGDSPLGVILMDIEMPVQDGLTCTRIIREMEREGKLKGPRIPIIAVSANARAEQILAAKQAGCDDVLVKPFRLNELVDKMVAVVQRLELEQQDGSAS